MLRTLTLKSQLKFGKFADYRVEQMLQIEKHEYLRWVYYNSSNISFMPDILEIIGVTEFITKPGVARELFERKPKERKVLTIAEASVIKHRMKKIHKVQIVQCDKVRHSTRANLMASNRKFFN